MKDPLMHEMVEMTSHFMKIRHAAEESKAAAEKSAVIRDQVLKRVDELEAELKKMKSALEEAKHTAVIKAKELKKKADAAAARDDDLRKRVEALNTYTNCSLLLFI